VLRSIPDAVPPKPYADSSNVQGSTLAGGISAKYGFPGDTVYPSAPESGAAKTLSSSQGVCAGLGD